LNNECGKTAVLGMPWVVLSGFYLEKIEAVYAVGRMRSSAIDPKASKVWPSFGQGFVDTCDFSLAFL